MASITTPLAAALLPLGLAFSAAALANGAAAPLPEAGAHFPNCELRAERHGAGIELESLVFADKPVSGSYRLRVVQGGAGGSAQISQGGEFKVGPGETGSLGSVSLRTGGSYSATLTVEWDDGSANCVVKAPVRYPKRVERLAPSDEPAPESAES